MAGALGGDGDVVHRLPVQVRDALDRHMEEERQWGVGVWREGGGREGRKWGERREANDDDNNITTYVYIISIYI